MVGQLFEAPQLSSALLTTPSCDSGAESQVRTLSGGDSSMLRRCSWSKASWIDTSSRMCIRGLRPNEAVTVFGKGDPAYGHHG